MTIMLEILVVIHTRCSLAYDTQATSSTDNVARFSFFRRTHFMDACRRQVDAICRDGAYILILSPLPLGRGWGWVLFIMFSLL